MRYARNAMRAAAGAVVGLALWAGGRALPAQDAVPLRPETLPAPRRAPPPAETRDADRQIRQALADAESCGVRGAMPLSLPVALRLAQTTNLDIAQAREVVAQAQAALLRAQVGILPNFNLGSTYVDHEGNIQRTEGNVIKVNRDSLFVGGGPSLAFGFSEALFLPLAARQVVAATEAGLRRVNDTTLLAVADAYFEVMRQRRRLGRIRETLEYLLSERRSPNRSDSKGLLPLMRDFVESGAAAAQVSELERVRVEVLRRREEWVGIIQDYLVASTELARLIRLDPAVPLWPVEDYQRPMPIPGGALLSRPLGDLAGMALANRPELAENRALVEAALARVRTAQYRPWLPSLVLNYNWGDFGGGPDPNPPIVRPPTTPGGQPTVVTQPGFGPSGRIKHFNTRTDFDVTLNWRLANLGLGNLAEVREREAEYRRLSLAGVQTQDLVVAQVVRTVEAIRGWGDRLEVTRSSLFDRRGRRDGPVFRSLRLTFDRIRRVPGTRPLEVLDSIRSLNDLLEAYAQAMTFYDRFRFRLLIALGLPPQAWGDPRLAAPGHHPASPDKETRRQGDKEKEAAQPPRARP